MNNKIVRNYPLLKSMALHGKIEMHPHTGKIVKTIFGSSVRAFYVQGIKDNKNSFEFRGKKYHERYFDGCFYPYIEEQS